MKEFSLSLSEEEKIRFFRAFEPHLKRISRKVFSRSEREFFFRNELYGFLDEKFLREKLLTIQALDHEQKLKLLRLVLRIQPKSRIEMIREILSSSKGEKFTLSYLEAYLLYQTLSSQTANSRLKEVKDIFSRKETEKLSDSLEFEKVVKYFDFDGELSKLLQLYRLSEKAFLSLIEESDSLVQEITLKSLEESKRFRICQRLRERKKLKAIDESFFPSRPEFENYLKEISFELKKENIQKKRESKKTKIKVF